WVLQSSSRPPGRFAAQVSGAGAASQGQAGGLSASQVAIFQSHHLQASDDPYAIHVLASRRQRRYFNTITTARRPPMAAGINRQIVLKCRPDGAPSLDNFELVQSAVPEPGEGEVLMRTRYLSLDPYMRGRMSAAKSYAKPVEIGEPMVGGTVGEVSVSRNAKFAAGDIVMGYGGWQDYALSNGAGLRKLDPSAAPVSTALGVLGMPGMTAYVGLLEIGSPKAGETVAVAAASGAVGSVVGQIAKIKGCRA